MITALRHLQFKYEPGIRLNSKQKGLIYAKTFVTEMILGAEFTVPYDFSKLILTERFGEDLVMEHTFVMRDKDIRANTKMCPVCVKIYEGSWSRVMIFKEGIHNFISWCNSDIISMRSRFVSTEIKMDLAAYMAEEHYADNQDSLDYLVKITEAPEAYFGPNRCYYVGIPYNDKTHDHDLWVKKLDDRYCPEEIADLDIKAITLYDDWASKRKETSKFSNYSSIDYMNEDFDPDIQPVTQTFNYGSLTRFCMQKSECTIGQILRRAGSIRGETREQTFTASTKLQDFVPITTFTSELLSLCNYIHSLPFLEISFRYILPKRGIPEGFNISHVVYRTRTPAEIQLIPSCLERILMLWDASVDAITATKFETDELFLEINSEMRTYKYYIDLTVTTLLTQEIAHQEPQPLS